MFRYRNFFFTEQKKSKFVENRVQSDASRAYNQQESASNNDGNVEAIAEAYPEEPIQGTVQFDQSDEQQYNEVVPLNAAPVSEEPKENAEIIPAEPKIPLAVSPEPQVQTTIAPKKKVHIALDIPDSNSQTQDENDGDEEDEYPYAAQKPSRNGAPMYTYFPVSFGRAAGGTIAVANALSMGKGAVRSHAIAYGASGASRRQPSASERHVSAAHKTA